MFLVLVFSGSLSAQQSGSGEKVSKSTDSIRLFVIGNSFSQNATRYLPQLATEGGHKLVIGRAELGGASMKRHWDAVEAAKRDTNDPKGKPYNGKSLLTLLSQGKWDMVTIQQYSFISGNVDSYRPYAKNLYDFIKSVQPTARVVIHQTWAYRSDDDTFGIVTPKVVATSQQQMYTNLKSAYHTIAKELGIGVIPTGDAFYKANSEAPWIYKKEDSFNYDDPQYPQLPVQTNSLHVGYQWNQSKKLGYDGHHANAAGCYLGGLVWYEFLFNESPVKLTFKPAELSQEFADYLKQNATKTVSENKFK